MLKILNLTKKYQKNVILNNFSYTFLSNTIYLIKGPNGSGKSTLLRCIMNFIKYQGKICYKKKVSYIPEKVCLPENITVKDFLSLLLQVKNLNEDNLNNYLKLFTLTKHLNKTLKTLSFGTLQKIIIVQGLSEVADIYLFDEPTKGLDSLSVQVFVHIISNLKNKIIIIVTHEIYEFKNLNYTLLNFEDGII